MEQDQWARPLGKLRWRVPSRPILGDWWEVNILRRRELGLPPTPPAYLILVYHGPDFTRSVVRR